MNAVFMHSIHLWAYSTNGYGFIVFDILGLICFMLAEIGIACLFMLFAYGWTLSFQDIDWDNNLEFYIPIGSIVLALHLVLGAMTYIDVDAYHKYHDFAGIQGFALVFIRLCLFGYYIYCFRTNKDKIPKRSQEIYRYFWVLGCLYFLIVPVTILTS
jgi:Rhodopsin-like GPCR transmembrane domain